jgi:hypothetical protein
MACEMDFTNVSTTRSPHNSQNLALSVVELTTAPPALRRVTGSRVVDVASVRDPHWTVCALSLAPSITISTA